MKIVNNQIFGELSAIYGHATLEVYSENNLQILGVLILKLAANMWPQKENFTFG